MESLPKSIKSLLCLHIFIAITAVLTAFLHKLSLHEPSYTSSPLIFIEVIATVLGLLLALPNLVAVFYLLIKKSYKDSFVAFLISILCLIVAYSALLIDAPTLLYAT